MIRVVKFQGGFANQLFQFCFLLKLKELYQKDEIYADISYYDSFDCHGGFKLAGVYNFEYYNLNNSDKVKVIDEVQYLANNVEGENEILYYDGYWQDEHFFPEDMNCIYKIFESIDCSEIMDYLSLIKNTESVSVHVRRGDYVNNPYHGNIATKQYYINAMQYFIKNLYNPTFFIFSDDIEWCKGNLALPSLSVIFVNPNVDNVHIDLYLMSQCKNNILSNSSYSWWAYKLNCNKSKSVLVPPYWINDGQYINHLEIDGAKNINNIALKTKKGSSPFFSIIVPVYNTAFLLRRCLVSVLNQTFDDIEVIIVNDGSTDDSVSVIEEYRCIDDRIVVVNKERNESLLAARITGMDHATGNYILFVDSDDYVVENQCELLKSYIEIKPVDIIEFGYKRVPSEEVFVPERFEGDSRVEAILRETINHTIWNKCYSRKLIGNARKNMELFYCNMSEDLYFSVLFQFYAKSYSQINDVLYFYAFDSGMTKPHSVSARNARCAVESIKNVHIKIKKFLRDNGYDYENELCEHEKLNYDFYREICDVATEQIEKKIELYSIIDGIGETQFSSAYVEKIKKGLTIYDVIYSRDRKKRVKVIMMLILDYLFDKHYIV